MSLTVKLQKTSSPKNKIGKTLTGDKTYNCWFKNPTSILRPVIVLETSDDLTAYNYMQISELGRSYFIDDIVSLHIDMWEIHAHVDVLETYATQIKANTAVIRRNENQYNLYLNDPELITLNTEQISTYKFSKTDFSKTLNYVLVVNGS
jgi:hypothetical protein